MNGASTANAFGNNGEKYYDGYQKDKDIKCVNLSLFLKLFIPSLMASTYCKKIAVL
jgi:hypothetical protein